jgi:hypothetical protein
MICFTDRFLPTFFTRDFSPQSCPNAHHANRHTLLDNPFARFDTSVKQAFFTQPVVQPIS